MAFGLYCPQSYLLQNVFLNSAYSYCWTTRIIIWNRFHILVGLHAWTDRNVQGTCTHCALKFQTRFRAIQNTWLPACLPRSVPTSACTRRQHTGLYSLLPLTAGRAVRLAARPPATLAVTRSPCLRRPVSRRSRAVEGLSVGRGVQVDLSLLRNAAKQMLALSTPDVPLVVTWSPARPGAGLDSRRLWDVQAISM